ncbi:hypothetical protein [Mycobacterium sp.]|uniref:hypothetical protein n=1 Tax=Mycobacterium sp. TaxID=1785 RepID=UPI0031D64BBD
MPGPGRHAVIAGGKIQNVVIADGPVAQANQWVSLDGAPPGVGPGWTYDGTTWSAPPAPVVPADPVASALDLVGKAGWAALPAAQQQQVIVTILQRL